MLDFAKTKCPAHFQFIRREDLAIPISDASVDLVFAFSLFSHLKHEETFIYLEHAHRVLRPGGSAKDENTVPLEEVSFAYGKIEKEYIETDHKTGKAKGSVKTHWSVVENKGG